MLGPAGAGAAPEGAGSKLDEEVACLRTVVQCISLSLASLQEEPGSSAEHQLSLHDTREMLALILSLVESDCGLQRMQTLVVDPATSPVDVLLACATADPKSLRPSYQHRETFTAVGFMNVRIQSLLILTRAITACTPESQSPETAELRASLFHHLTGSGAVDTLLKFVSNSAEPEQIRTAAAECLYVFLSRVDEAKEAVVRLHAMKFFFEVLWREPAKMVRNYVCAILRVVAQKYSEQLLDVAIVERGVAHLQHEESKHVAIMLLDIFAITFTNYNNFYLQRVCGTADLVQCLCRLCEAVLHRNTQVDITQSTTKLMGTIMSIEGLDRARTPFLSTVLATGCWKSLVGLHLPAAGEWDDTATRTLLLKVSALRCLIENCTTQPLIQQLTASMSGFFPCTSFLLNVPLDDACPKELRHEVSLALLVWLAKSPEARQFIRTSLQQYTSWGDSLKLRLVDMLAEISPAVYEDIYIVDCNLSYINNSASEPHIDYADMAQVFTAVRAILRDQEEGSLREEAGPRSPHLQAKSNTFAAADARAPMKLGQRKQRLTCALLNYVVACTFGDALPPAPHPAHPGADPPRSTEVSRVEDHEQASPMSAGGGDTSPRSSPPPQHRQHHHRQGPDPHLPLPLPLPLPPQPAQRASRSSVPLSVRFDVPQRHHATSSPSVSPERPSRVSVSPRCEAPEGFGEVRLAPPLAPQQADGPVYRVPQPPPRQAGWQGGGEDDSCFPSGPFDPDAFGVGSAAPVQAERVVDPLADRPAWPPWPPPPGFGAEQHVPPQQGLLSSSQQRQRAAGVGWTPGQPHGWSHLSHDPYRQPPQHPAPEGVPAAAGGGGGTPASGVRRPPSRAASTPRRRRSQPPRWR